MQRILLMLAMVALLQTITPAFTLNASVSFSPQRDAATAVTSHAKNLRDRVYGFLQEQHPSAYSADQIAAPIDIVHRDQQFTKPWLSEVIGEDLDVPMACVLASGAK